MQSTSSQKITGIINVLSFALVIAANALSIFLPLNGKSQMQLSAQYPNLFTPAGFTFSIWSIIYMLLLGFIIYQLYVLFISWHVNKQRIMAISPLFIGVCLCNAGWLFAWHYEWITVSVIIMIVHLLLLIRIHEKLQLSLSWQFAAPKLWLDLPFSIYLGWICVALIANVAAWCVGKGYTLSFLLPQVWTIIMVIAALLIGMFYVFTRNNKVVAAAIAWAFYGILSKRKEVGDIASHPVIVASEIALAILLLIILLNTLRRRNNEDHSYLSA